MTQPDATRRTASPTRYRPAPGDRVRKAGSDEIGVIVTSDDWFDSLRIRNVPENAQVLVEWPRGGNPLRIWEEIADLTDADRPAPKQEGAK